jgi:hypothetical protein
MTRTERRRRRRSLRAWLRAFRASWEPLTERQVALAITPDTGLVHSSGDHGLANSGSVACTTSRPTHGG